MANYVLDHTGQLINTKLTKAENIDNKVTSISALSTDTQYPSAKLLYDLLQLKLNSSSVGSIVLLANSWVGDTSPYTLNITLSGYTVTANTKVDLLPNETVLNLMYNDNCMALYVINNSGTLTTYAINEKPSTNLTIQYSAKEVNTI